MNRRQLLGSSAIWLLMSSSAVRAAVVKGGIPWKPGAADPPNAVMPGEWKYFTPQEAATVEAFVDRKSPESLGCSGFAR
jgi:gluconate 2-dehydrogenase gamma chain